MPQQVFGMAVLNDWIASSIQVAAYYGIADLLQDGPKSIAELAAATQTDPDSLYRLLRTLASVGFFEEATTDGGHHLECCVMVQSRKTGSQFRPGFSIFPFMPLHKTRYGVRFRANAVLPVSLPGCSRLDVCYGTAIWVGMGASLLG